MDLVAVDPNLYVTYMIHLQFPGAIIKFQILMTLVNVQTLEPGLGNLLARSQRVVAVTWVILLSPGQFLSAVIKVKILLLWAMPRLQTPELTLGDWLPRSSRVVAVHLSCLIIDYPSDLQHWLTHHFQALKFEVKWISIGWYSLKSFCSTTIRYINTLHVQYFTI